MIKLLPLHHTYSAETENVIYDLNQPVTFKDLMLDDYGQPKVFYFLVQNKNCMTEQKAKELKRNLEQELENLHSIFKSFDENK